MFWFWIVIQQGAWRPKVSDVVTALALSVKHQTSFDVLDDSPDDDGADWLRALIVGAWPDGPSMARKLAPATISPRLPLTSAIGLALTSGSLPLTSGFGLALTSGIGLPTTSGSLPLTSGFGLALTSGIGLPTTSGSLPLTSGFGLALTSRHHHKVSGWHHYKGLGWHYHQTGPVPPSGFGPGLPFIRPWWFNHNMGKVSIRT